LTAWTLLNFRKVGSIEDHNKEFAVWSSIQIEDDRIPGPRLVVQYIFGLQQNLQIKFMGAKEHKYNSLEDTMDATKEKKVKIIMKSDRMILEHFLTRSRHIFDNNLQNDI